MKQCLTLAILTLSALFLCSGCVGVGFGSTGPRTEVHPPTLGQQLIDLQKARAAGAITPAEYDAKKADLLAKK